MPARCWRAPDFGRRFPTIAAAVLALPVRSRIIDGELIAHGAPDFLALLHARHVPVCVCASIFVNSRAKLEALLARSKGKLIRFSDRFPDADVLLAECARRGLEGIRVQAE